jgi:hypothetical protein
LPKILIFLSIKAHQEVDTLQTPPKKMQMITKKIKILEVQSTNKIISKLNLIVITAKQDLNNIKTNPHKEAPL